MCFFCPQLILQKSNGQFQRNLWFFKVPEGVQHFPGGGSNFFQGGSNCLFPIETHITCDFPGGPDPLSPLWIRTWHLIGFKWRICLIYAMYTRRWYGHHYITLSIYFKTWHCMHITPRRDVIFDISYFCCSHAESAHFAWNGNVCVSRDIVKCLRKHNRQSQVIWYISLKT